MTDTDIRNTFVVFGKVTNGIRFVPDVRTEITFNDFGDGKAKGIFFGDERISRELGEVLLSGNASFEGIWSTQSTSYNIIFRITGISFRTFSSHSKTEKLCEFECGKLELEKTYYVENEELKIVDHLAIHYIIPRFRELSIPHFPVEWKKDLPDYKEWLEYDTKYGLMKIETIEREKEITVESQTGSFSFYETSVSFLIADTENRTSQIILDTNKIVLDYLSLISLILQCRVEYYKQVTLEINNQHQEIKETISLFHRSLNKKNERPILFEWHTVDKLLKELIPLYSFHSEKENIREAILLFLAGIETNVAEIQLVLFHSAIETLVNTLRSVFDMQSVKCEKCKKDSITLRDIILNVVLKLNVDISDIYPSPLADPQRTFPFIKYRNSFSHGRRNEIDYDDLHNELYRQQILLERLIMHWIGIDTRDIDYLKLWSGIKPY